MGNAIELDLISKLESTLETVGPDQTKLESSQLETFIDQVQAQRGTGIQEEVADELIAIARELINSPSS